MKKKVIGITIGIVGIVAAIAFVVEKHTHKKYLCQCDEDSWSDEEDEWTDEEDIDG